MQFFCKNKPYMSSYRYIIPPLFMADNDQKQQSVKKAEERREEKSGDKNIGFGGTLLDLGEKDAKGVGEGK